MKTTYVRFVVGTNREEPREQTGVVTSLRLLRDKGELPDYEVEHAEELFSWLNTHLPCPPFSEKRWSSDAISWFKGSAQGMIAKFRELVALLEQHDQPVQMLTTE